MMGKGGFYGNVSVIHALVENALAMQNYPTAYAQQHLSTDLTLSLLI